MSEQVSTRKATVVDTSVSIQGQDCNRWAVIVGISKYKNAALNLKYADRDAEKLYQLLLTPHGGHFQKEYICKLTNKEATKGNVTRALRSFLKKPAREDLVIIYFACHGSPDPDRPGNVYLLTHDCDPQDIAGTALPMDDIDRALKDTLLSEKVIIFADTCHSAAIGGGIRSRAVTENTKLINRYLQHISQARKGTALLTSAEANEVSFEDKKWGGGHGVFTYYLLRGLRGEADANKNGFVAVGELFEYVRENVKKATNHRQHPSIGTNPFDRNMPLAIAFPNAKDNQAKPTAADAPVSNLLGGALPVWSGERSQLASKKRYAVIALAALLLGGGGILAGISGGWFGGAKPSDRSGPVVENVGNYGQVLRYAEALETAATAQMEEMVEGEYTESGLDGVISNWDQAQEVLQSIESGSAGYAEVQKVSEAYRNQWRYATALKLGLIAGERSALRDENTSEEWDAIIGLREEAIALLREIPIEATQVYADARRKISEYRAAISINKELRLRSRFDHAVRKANEADEASLKAESSYDWDVVAGLWGEASERMQQVMPEDSSRYGKAQQKITEYADKQIYARQRADLLKERELQGEGIVMNQG